MVNFIKNSDDEYTPRELVKHAFEHKETPRVPFSFGMGINLPPKMQLTDYLGYKDVQQVDDFFYEIDDIRNIYIPYIGPKDRNCALPDGGYIDIWGVKRSPVKYTENGFYNEISHYPMADIKSVSDLDSFEWPSPDWFDYSGISDVIKQVNPDGKYAVKLGNGNIFETTWYMRGLEQTLADFLDEPEPVYNIFERVTNYFTEYFNRALSAAKGQIDIIFTADDIAGQTGLLFSPKIWKEQLKPWHKKLNAKIHEHDVKILYHTDGAAHSVIEDMIDMGIDAWEAVQTDAAGMDAQKIKDAAGDKLAIHGGISVQQLLPFGSEDDVRKEVTELINIFGKNGGYIAAPSHAIQAGTPPENIVAMIETARPDLGRIKQT